MNNKNGLLISLIAFSLIWGLINSVDHGWIKFDAMEANAGNVPIGNINNLQVDSITGAVLTSTSIGSISVQASSATTAVIQGSTSVPNSAAVIGDALSVANHATTPMYVQQSTSTATIGSVTCLNCPSATVTQGQNGTWPWPVTLGSLTSYVNNTWPTPAGTNVIGHVILDSGTLTTLTGITNALPSGTNVIGHIILDSGTLTSITNSVTVIQPTGTNLHTTLDNSPTVNQGSPQANANAWPTCMTDLTNCLGTTSHPVNVNQGLLSPGVPGSPSTGDMVTSFMAGSTGTHMIGDDGSNNLQVNCKVGCTATAVTDGSVFTANTSNTGPVGGVYNDGLGALSSGTRGEVRITPSRAFHVNLRNNSGTLIGDTTTPIVDNLYQINGHTILEGNGVTGNGSPRVTISSDQTPFGVTQSGNWTTGPKQTTTKPTEFMVAVSTSTVAVVTLPASFIYAYAQSDSLNTTTQTLYVCIGNNVCGATDAGDTLVPGQRKSLTPFESQTVFAKSSSGTLTIRGMYAP